MTASGLTAYAPHMATGDQDSLAVHLAMSAFHALRQRVTIINLPEFDWPLGHLDGGIADKSFAWQLMNRLDGDVAYIEDQLRAAHVLKQTLFVLTADHGMATLNHAVSYQAIEKAVQAAGTTWVRYDYHTAGYLWLHDPGKAAEVASQIMRIGDPRIRAVYYRKPDQTTYTLTGGGKGLVPGVTAAYEYLLGTMAGATSPHVVVLLADDTSIRGPNQTTWHGDHGGAAWGSEHIPLILSGPGVRRGVLSHYPASLIDIAPTVLHLLGASSQGMDGIDLADAMLQPSDADVTEQAKRGQELTPLVDALVRQSKSDGP
jgi:arylsulfatase A-like enzyme